MTEVPGDLTVTYTLQPRHRPCGSIALPVLQSETYEEIIADVAESLNALRSNKSLQKEFLSVLKKPERDLPNLSSEVVSEPDKGVETSVRDQLYRMTEGPEIPAAARERHWQCGPIAMPAVRSETYRGVIDEMAEYLDALLSNKSLQKEFLSILKKPGRNLLNFGNELGAVQEALVTQSKSVELESFPGINSTLSAAPAVKLSEVKALMIATEAFRGLSAVPASQIVSLTAEEKANLFILFREIPLSSSAHSFIRPPFPESDNLYSQLLKKIGFGQFQGHLIYETDDSGVDMITLAITAMQAVTVPE